MADHQKVVVYVTAEQGRALRAHGVTDIPTWVRQLVKDAVRIRVELDDDEEAG